MRLKTLLRRLRRYLAVMRRGRRVLSQREYVRRGLYVAESPTVWRRVGTRIPDFLRVTKAPTAGDARPFPPKVLWTAGAGTAEVAVASFEGGAVFLDLKNRRVTRSYPPGVLVDPQQAELRRRFERHVSAPHAEYAPDGRSHTEELVEGDHLDSLAPAQQLEAVRRLFVDYGHLVAAEGEGDSAATLLEALESAARLATPPRLVTLAAGASELVGDLRIPWVPSAREANLKNLIIRRDLTAAPIDLGDLTLLPSLWYPLGIICEAKGDVIQAYRRGAFDGLLPSLFTSASPEAAGRPQWRDELLTARLVYAAEWDARAAGAETGETTAALVTDGLHRRWAAMEPFLT